MRNSVKSLQNVVNEAMTWLGRPTVSASALSQARYKLKHTAFIELNQVAIVETLYGNEDYLRFWGFRVLAIDGSKLVLPDNEAIREEFGTIAWSNGKDAEIQGERPYALASVLYDVLNRVALDATLGKAKAYEVDLAVGHLPHTRVGDLLTMDRNYLSYRMLAELSRCERDFVIRCSAASFAEAREMLKGQGPDSQEVTLKPCAGQLALIREIGLPLSLKVRLVRVLLNTGEYEVLVTSLLDNTRYPTDGFRELYYLRWGIETFYGLLKTRLELENFTGIGAEAIRQDFHATVYLSGLESLLTDTAQAMLDAKVTQYPQSVNRAVSFNAIKNRALDLLLVSGFETEQLLAQLTSLFLTNPCLERSQRKPARKNSSARVLLNFHKRQKKHCF
jgi:DDE family transposase